VACTLLCAAPAMAYKVIVEEFTMHMHQSPAPGPRNTSGVVGVYWNKQHQHWQASIKRSGRLLCLGNYRELRDAILARKVAERIRRQLSEDDTWWQKWLGCCDSKDRSSDTDQWTANGG